MAPTLLPLVAKMFTFLNGNNDDNISNLNHQEVLTSLGTVF